MAGGSELRRIEESPAPPGGRALVLGDGPSAERLRAAGWSVVQAASPDPLGQPDEHFHIALATGPFGRYEWDRWLLQELHRVLVPGGTLAVTVPNLTSLVSPADWAFFLSRVGVQARRSLARALRRPPPTIGFHGRRYRIAAFAALLPPLGFSDLRIHPEPAPIAPLVREYVVTAVRTASRYGVEPARPYPPANEHRERYAAANAAFFDNRSAWLRAHPEFADRPVKALVPESFGGRDVLVLAPHPDDEVIGCGGTLGRLIGAGARVTTLQATDGCEGAALRDVPEAVRRNIRLEEAAAVGRALGFREVVYWRADNADFRCTDERVQRMRELLARLKPALVFTPYVADIHPDHGTLNVILARALGGADTDLRVLQYEVWGLVPANTWCDVTSMGAQLERWLRLYPTAMKVDDFVHFCEDRNYYHSITLAGREGLAEAFLECSAAEHRALADPERVPA